MFMHSCVHLQPINFISTVYWLHHMGHQQPSGVKVKTEAPPTQKPPIISYFDPQISKTRPVALLHSDRLGFETLYASAKSLFSLFSTQLKSLRPSKEFFLCGHGECVHLRFLPVTGRIWISLITAIQFISILFIDPQTSGSGRRNPPFSETFRRTMFMLVGGDPPADGKIGNRKGTCKYICYILVNLSCDSFFC